MRCSTFGEPEGLRDQHHTAIEISVADTGCGMQSDKLEYIFREFEQVESSEQKPGGEAGVGMNSISVVSEHRLTPTAPVLLTRLGSCRRREDCGTAGRPTPCRIKSRRRKPVLFSHPSCLIHRREFKI